MKKYKIKIHNPYTKLTFFYRKKFLGKIEALDELLSVLEMIEKGKIKYWTLYDHNEDIQYMHFSEMKKCLLSITHGYVLNNQANIKL